MQLSMGSIFKKIRKEKGLTLKEMQTNNLSISQLSKIENGENIPSADKFIEILSLLNLKYDEFILLLDNNYLHSKALIGTKYAEYGNAENITSLKELSIEAQNLFQKYGDIYFQHIHLQIEALLTLIDTNNHYETSREFLLQIKEYFLKVNNWGDYELYLLSNCLFMFEIDDAIFFGNIAIKIIEKNYKFYRNQSNARVLLNNLTMYSLDYEEHLFFSLNCAKMCEELSFTSQDTYLTIHSQIYQQIAYYKLKNGKFNKDKLQSLIQTFKLIGWDNIYTSIRKFVRKHGITLDS